MCIDDCRMMSDYEYAGQGIQFSNMNDGLFSFSSCLVMMFVDFVLYGVLAWYFDLVLPQEYGTPEHPLFFLSPKLWMTLIDYLSRLLFPSHVRYDRIEDIVLASK